MAIDLHSPRSIRFPDSDTSESFPRARRDTAFVSRPFFLRLTEVLRRVADLLNRCRSMQERSTRHERTWGVPKLFFADGAAQAEWRAKQGPAALFPEPFIGSLTASFPKFADAWDRLPDLLDDALSHLAESIDVRRMARAVPGLCDAALGVPQVGELAGILGLREEEVWLVIHPAARAGFRVVLEGVADVAQLHVLLADRLTGDPSRGYLAGRRPNADALAACQDTAPNEGVVATGRFQFYRPEALRANGTLPRGFEGASTWFWGRETLDTVPQQNGERILLIGEPVLPTTWEVTRRFSRIAAEAKMVDVLTAGEVETWLRARSPKYRPSSLPVQRAA